MGTHTAEISGPRGSEVRVVWHGADDEPVPSPQQFAGWARSAGGHGHVLKLRSKGRARWSNTHTLIYTRTPRLS